LIFLAFILHIQFMMSIAYKICFIIILFCSQLQAAPLCSALYQEVQTRTNQEIENALTQLEDLMNLPEERRSDIEIADFLRKQVGPSLDSMSEVLRGKTVSLKDGLRADSA
jgi:hypothetical protein